MMKKILITGGAGFIGSHTAVELFLAGYEPVILDDFRNSEKWIIDRIEKITKKQITVYEGNCLDLDFLDQVFNKEKNISGVIHFAGLKAVGESVKKPLLYYKNNIGSALSVLEIMKKHKVKNLVFSSSATVYGNQKKNPISETISKKPATNPYGKTKSMIEDILEDSIKAKSDFSIISLRYFNPIGAHPSGLLGELPLGIPANLVPYISQTAIGIRSQLTIFGDDYNTPDGTGIRDFIHVIDLARAHIATLQYLEKQNSPFYDIFNVGSGQGTSVKELIDVFQKVNKVSVPYQIGARRSGDIGTCFADVSKINKIIGWKSVFTISDALKDTWRWQKELGNL